MGQRDSRHHHANRRRKLDMQRSSRGQKNIDLEERAPLAGYERLTVKGAVVTLAKDKAVAESWAAKETRAEAT